VRAAGGGGAEHAHTSVKTRIARVPTGE
jgi:hypothetical protein